ncbi:MAG: ATP-binding protein, partial [Polyangiaceae bacterium]
MRHALRGARDDLSTALGDLSSGSSDVPQAGPDALADPQIDVDITEARAERQRVETEAASLTAQEATLRDQGAAQLLDEADTLNRERLALLDFLSPEKRSAITGFTSAGLDQAASEVRQLTLTLRYHRYIVTRWFSSLRQPGHAIGAWITGNLIEIVECLGLIGVFFWWRRRSGALLRALRARAHASDRLERLPTASPLTRALSFISQTHGPLEWVLFLLLLTWVLPSAVESILEIRVLSSIIAWTFGAAFVVDAINALASSDHVAADEGASIDAAALRVRSLRLVGRTVVGFGLVLVISSMVVGRGTIYSWVFSTCWLASVPILLILVRWWRDVVFRRTDRIRKKSAFQTWVLAHREGWSSFPAATAGGAHLFVASTIRVVRAWVSRFDVTRRFLAYLFRRELTKLGSDQPGFAVGPIDAQAFTALGPETTSAQWIASDLDEPLALLATRIRERRGGIIAIVGERGLGKTSALRRIRDEAASAALLETPTTNLADLRALLAKEAGLPTDATLDAAAQALEASADIHAVLLDDLQHFIRPIIGGLADFDAFLAVASRHCKTTTWVVTIDDVIWQFLERSRGARPVFDDVIRIAPWREEEIVGLLRARTEQAHLTPSFEHLLERLPANADEIDKAEAISQRARDYYRLLWDYAYGNPAVALHMWRRSLGSDSAGSTAVRLFKAMDTSDLERLPDRAIFVLRAVLQLSPANPSQIAQATMLRPADVADALRYALSRAYIEEQGAGYSVSWTWFRAVTLFLKRRH